MFRRSILLLPALLLAACAARTPLPVLEGPLPEGTAKLVVQRSTDLLLSGMGARLVVNGSVIGNLFRGDTMSMPVPAGQVVLYVDQPGPVQPGQIGAGPGSRRVLTAEAGREYRLEVVPTTRLVVALVVPVPGTESRPRQAGDNGWFGFRDLP